MIVFLTMDEKLRANNEGVDGGSAIGRAASNMLLQLTQFDLEGWGAENALVAGRLNDGAHQVVDRRPPSHNASRRTP